MKGTPTMQTIETAQAETLTAEEVAALIADAPAETPAAFMPDDERGVDWVLGKIADRRARAARIRENAEKMASAEEREAEALEWRFGWVIQAWLKAELDGGKRKSIRLFHGVIGYRTRPAGVSVTDPAAALEWARFNLPAAVTEALDKKALAETLLTTGEALPFVQLLPAEEVFYIR